MSSAAAVIAPTTAPSVAAGLPADAVETYGRDGFLCPVEVFSAAEAAQYRAELEALERRFTQHDSALPHPLAQYLRVNAHNVLTLPSRLAADPRVLEPVASLLGPDLLLWSGEFFIKEAGSPKIVSWHQDLTYWGMDGSDHEVTAWIALSPATRTSGCMRFVPGSHRREIVPHEDTFAEDNLLSRGQEIAVDVDEAEAVDAALAPGQMSLHHGRLFHASGPNESADRRIALVLRFIRPDTPKTGPGEDYAMVMRGVDRVGARRAVAPPKQDFTPDSLVFYDEVRSAQAGTLAAGADKMVGFYAADTAS